jgi:hypothetical protein
VERPAGRLHRGSGLQGAQPHVLRPMIHRSHVSVAKLALGSPECTL